MLIFPKGLEYSRVQANFSRSNKSSKLFVAFDEFPVIHHTLKGDLVQVDLGECEGSIILLDDRPTITHQNPGVVGNVSADEGNGVEGNAAVDLKQI